MMLTLLVVLGVIVVANSVVLGALGAQYRREVARRHATPIRLLTPVG